MSGLILMSLAAAASTPVAAPRLVHVELRDGARVVAQPAIAVAPGGGPAVMQVGGPQGYRLSVALEPAEVAGAYVARLSYDRPVADGWHQVASPVLLVGKDQPARIETGQAGEPKLSLTVRVD